MTLRIPTKKRKAISPVLATVILIAITLIAAIAIAGFVFGLFGSFTSSAQVSASVTSCVKATGLCTLTLTNSGTSNVVSNSCRIQDLGTSAAGTIAFVAPSTTLTVPAGGVAHQSCSLGAASNSAVGSQAIGSIGMSNGATVPFSGVWS